MRYLLIIVAVIQFLIGVIWIYDVIRTAPGDAMLYIPGALNVLAGMFGLRVGVKGKGHFGLVLFNGIILTLVVIALIAKYGSLQNIPWKDLDVILIVCIPSAPIVLSLLVGKPKRDEV